MRQLKTSVYDALLRCASPHTEAPDRFILWSAFSVIGSVLKNRVYVKDGLFTIYPNQYIILVSPPGIGKGTTINFSWGVVRDTAPNYIVNMISDRVTAPRILERIATGWNTNMAKVVNGQVIIGGSVEHTCTIFSTELGVLVGASEWMLEFLCESWDRNSYDYDTKNKGSSIVTDMCTSLIGGTVPDYIQGIERDNKRSIKGGFTSRCVFVYEDTPSRYLPFPPAIGTNPQSVALLGSIKNDLEHISQTLAGEYTYNTEARIKFENFLKLVRTGTSNDIEPVANFKARIRAHVLKLAMILAAARKDTMVIDGIDMANAIVFTQRIIADLNRIFRGTGDSELSVAASKVQEYIELKGMATKKELLTHLYRHMTVETLDRVLYTLEAIGFCDPITRGKQTFFKHRNGSKP